MGDPLNRSSLSTAFGNRPLSPLDSITESIIRQERERARLASLRSQPPLSAPTVNWAGLSGTVLAFELHPIGTEFKAIPGVYVFCRQVGTGLWAATYVGETESLRDRLWLCLRDHHQLAAIRACGATHVSVRVTQGTRNARLTLEADLRRGLRPPCNQQ